MVKKTEYQAVSVSKGGRNCSVTVENQYFEFMAGGLAYLQGALPDRVFLSETQVVLQSVYPL